MVLLRFDGVARRKVDRKRLKELENLSGVLKINFLKTPRFEHYRKLLFLSLFLIKLLWDFAKTHLQLDHCDNNNDTQEFSIYDFSKKRKKKNHLSFLKYSPKSFKTNPSSVLQYSKLNAREAGWTVYPSPSSPLFP